MADQWTDFSEEEKRKWIDIIKRNAKNRYVKKDGTVSSGPELIHALAQGLPRARDMERAFRPLLRIAEREVRNERAAEDKLRLAVAREIAAQAAAEAASKNSAKEEAKKKETVRAKSERQLTGAATTPRPKSVLSKAMSLRSPRPVSRKATKAELDAMTGQFEAMNPMFAGRNNGSGSSSGSDKEKKKATKKKSG